MKVDETTQWGHAPTAMHWHCPECKVNSAVKDWQGDGDKRTCPACQHVYVKEERVLP